MSLIIQTRSGATDPDAVKWFVLYTSPQGERLASEDLADLGLLPFLPLARVWHRPARHRRSKGKSLVERPLFPRYMFVGLRPSIDSLETVYRSKRVLEVLADATGRPVAIDGPRVVKPMMDEIARGQYDAAVIRAQKLASLLGRSVRIDSGPFQGFIGTIVRVSKKTCRIEAQHNLIAGASIPLEIPLADLDRSGLFSLQDTAQTERPRSGVGHAQRTRE